ncbi:hypothetical protein SAMN02745229_02986 [Butyrivibrio fibrisolvens DSM 3071]|uniref:Uncharacterized protein n=1 Tax=Butyrivibrio fibrisolvens DSM 3071 TaxID=1121131 RepID=A0A1M6ANA3_BUTFI|nr:hypothetical protein [Butyrivibrio fibrisolvens]SHI37999.1 hypothetical protein SAMN02745229_02986 [Butyrivibrio fibrisolvens DSM 3071]
MELLIKDGYMEGFEFDNRAIAPYIESINRWIIKKKRDYISNQPMAVRAGEDIDLFISKELRYKISRILTNNNINKKIIEEILNEPYSD